MENVQTIPPPYVVRTVLIYSRHAGQLQFNPSEAVSVSTTRCDFSVFARPQHHYSLVLNLTFLCPTTENATVSIFFL